MTEEINAHEKGEHWEVVEQKLVPKDKPILPTVWTMKQKQWIDMQQVYKWKA